MNTRAVAITFAVVLAVAACTPQAGSSPLLSTSPGDEGRAVPAPSFSVVDRNPPPAAREVSGLVQSTGSQFADAWGGSYWDQDGQRYVYRVVDSSPDAGALDAAIAKLLEQRSPLPVPFARESTQVTVLALRQQASRLNADRTWAGDLEPELFDVAADELNMLLWVSVKSQPDELAQLAAKASGIDAYATVGGGPARPAGLNGSRRNDNPNPGYYNGVALWTTPQSDATRYTQGAHCTAGFRMNKGASHFFSSALHCMAYNGLMYHGQYPITRTSGVYGGSNDLSLLAPWTDAGAPSNLSPTLAPPTFWGGQATTTTAPVSGKLSVPPDVGEIYWSSGANGGKVAMKTLSYNNCGAWEQLVFGRTNYGQPGSNPAIVGGDSGGPVVDENRVSAESGDQIAAGVVNCSNDGATTTGDRAWWTPIHRLELLSGSAVALQ